MRLETVIKFANNCIKTIQECKQLKQYKLDGFIKGIAKGKCRTVLGDSIEFLYEDLEKQIFDYHVALAQRKSLMQCLADLSNVAECLFVKLNAIRTEENES